VNRIDPSGLYGGMAGVSISCAIGSNMQANNNRVQIGTGIQLKQKIQFLQKAFDLFDKIMDVVDTVDGAMDLLTMGPGFIMDFAQFYQKAPANINEIISQFGGNVVQGVVARGNLDLPESIIQKLQRLTKNALNLNKVQEIIGAIATNLIARALGFNTVFIQLAYTGIDAIYDSRGTILPDEMNMFVIAESKGGNSTLKDTKTKGKQMYDKWIDNSIKEIAKKNQNEDDYQRLVSANKLGLSMLAMIVKLNVRGNDPTINLAMQFYKGPGDTLPNSIVSWDKPFE
jgi:hypothetical protein